MPKLLARLEKSKSFWFLLIVSFGFFLLRLPSLFEPYWYGDEGIYEVIGFALRHGRLLYQGIADNKPPLLYLIFALFDGSQGPVRFFSLLVGLSAVISFFFLARKLFEQEKIVFTTTTIFAVLLGLPLIEGNIANSENFMILPTLLSALLLLHLIQNDTYPKPYTKELKTFVYAGILLGLSFLFKIVAVFDLGAFALFIFFIVYKRHASFFGSLLKVIPLFVGFFIPFLLTVAYFSLHGILGDFFHFVFSSNVGYVNYANQLFIPQGLLILKLIMLAGCTFWLFLRRDKLSFTQIFIWLWLAFSLFNAFFSQRPYTHYMLVLIGSLSLFVGLIMQDSRRQKQLALVLLAIMLLLVSSFTFYTKTLPYYQNFISFVFGTKSVTAYRSFFDAHTPRDYDIALFFEKNKKPNDTLFVWGDNGQVYKLINELPPGRFIVAYHINASDKTRAETATALRKAKPRFIVVLPNQKPLPISLTNYSEVVILQQAVIYARDN